MNKQTFVGAALQVELDPNLQLRMHQGGSSISEVSVSKFPAAIGRDGDADISLSGLWVGRQHAEIQLKHDALFVRDQGTLAGTFVNSDRVTEYGPLKLGDQIQIGSWTLEVLGLQLTRADRRADEPFSEQLLVDRGVLQLRSLIDIRKRDWQGVSDQAIRAECRELMEPIARELLGDTPQMTHQNFVDRVVAESVGLGPLEQLFHDPEISEVMVNRFDEIFAERAGVCHRVPLRFASDESVRSIIDRIVSPLGKRIDESSPMVDARLQDGSRVNAVIPPLAIKGCSLTIRRFSKKRLQAEDLCNLGSASQAMLAILELAVRHRLNIVVSGGTGSGKTTLLNLLSQWIPSHERIVTIEDAAELQLGHLNLVSLEVRQANAEGQGAVTIRDLLRNSLRMRPDRIVVGECRGGEALDMLQAMNTGHEGSLTTVHANSPRDALARLEMLVLMAGFDLPLVAIREQISSAVDLIVQQQRCADGRRRLISISEVTGVESGVVQTQEVFTWRPDQAKFCATGVVPHFFERLSGRGVTEHSALYSLMVES